MTRTENLNLPQWEATDPIRREDFNGAFAAIDAAGGGAECVVINTLGFVDGDTIYTFPKTPKCVILRGYYDGTIVPSGGTGFFVDYYSDNTDRKVTFQLSGKELILATRTYAYAAKELTVAAFY